MVAIASHKISDSFNRYSLQPLVSLPSQMVINILVYLPVKSAIDLCLACRALQQVQKESSLWKCLCIRDFFSGVSMEHRRLPEVQCAWKTYYRLFEPSLLIDFPGKSASFKLMPSEDWRVTTVGKRLVRRLSFESKTPGCLFEKITLVGDGYGDISLSVEISKDLIDVAVSYFKKLALKKEEFTNGFFFTNFENRIKIFKVLLTFNKIQENFLVLAERLGFSKQWELITPLTHEEIQKSNAEIEEFEKSLQPKTWGEWLIKKIIIDPLFGNFFAVPKIFPTVLDKS